MKGEHNLEWDVADFWVFDSEFRNAVNARKVDAPYDVRHELWTMIQKVFKENEKPPHELLGKIIGEITNIPTRSVLRKKLLSFLHTLRGQADYQPPTQEERNSKTTTDYLTPGQRQQKSEAKRLYQERRYQEALEIMLSVYRSDPRQRNHLGTLGFIMNCYNKLADWGNALLFAERIIALERETTVSVGIALLAACKLEQYGIALHYAERYMHLQIDKLGLSIAAISAQRLEQYEKALQYAEQYLSRFGEHIAMLGVAALSAQRKEMYDKALQYAEGYLLHQREVTILGIACESAYHAGQFKKALQYGKEYLGLKISIHILAIVSQSAYALRDFQTTLSYAAMFCEQVDTLTRDNLGLLCGAAKAALLINDREKALSFAYKILQIDSNNPFASQIVQ